MVEGGGGGGEGSRGQRGVLRRSAWYLLPHPSPYSSPAQNKFFKGVASRGERSLA